MVSFSSFGIGCGRLGSLSNDTPLKVVRQALEDAANRGITTFDTSNIYGQGDSERILGRLFGARDDIAIVTKAGRTFSKKALLLPSVKWALKPLIAVRKSMNSKRTPLSNGVPALTATNPKPMADALTIMRARQVSYDFSPDALERSLSASLKRLKRKSVAGFLLHDPATSVIEDTGVVARLTEIKRSGLADHIGISLNSIEDIEAVARISAYDLIQAPVSLIEQVKDSSAYREIVARGTLVHVRQALRREGADIVFDIKAAIADALSLPGVKTVLVGVSKPDHLKPLI